MFRVSDDGPSRWCGLQRGRRPKAGKERTRGWCARKVQRAQLWGLYDAKGGCGVGFGASNEVEWRVTGAQVYG
jgi:hypothetical protein